MFEFDLGVGIIVAIVLAAALWIPYFIKEIRRGKAQLGPRSPVGAGDARPGNPMNPAPGQPSGQPDPYSPEAQRSAPHIKS